MTAVQLRGLGWTVTASWLEKGRITEVKVRRELKAAVKKKRAFLASHTYTLGTCGEETHERVSGWCDRAEAVLAGEEAGDE